MAIAVPLVFPQPPMNAKLMDSQGNLNATWLQWFSLIFARIQSAAYVPGSVSITGGSITGATIINVTQGIKAPTFTGNATTATLAATATNALACSGNSATATNATNATNASIAASCSGNSATATALAPGAGLSTTITTAALTTLGSQGSMTFVNGVLTAETPAT